MTWLSSLYRCIIGGYHHQWSSGGIEPPKAALRRFLVLVMQPDNARITLDEIQAIRGRFDRYDAAEVVDKKKSNAIEYHISCPQSLFLLASAWNSDLQGDLWGEVDVNDGRFPSFALHIIDKILVVSNTVFILCCSIRTSPI